MLESVMFCGRAEARAEIPRQDWAVISISEWGSDPAHLQEGWHSILRLEFHDIDEEKMDKPYDLFSETQAWQIIEFVRRVAPDVSGILVHCRAGISRSAAVAKWIAEEFDLRFNEKYRLYNRHVFNMLRKIGSNRGEK